MAACRGRLRSAPGLAALHSAPAAPILACTPPRALPRIPGPPPRQGHVCRLRSVPFHSTPLRNSRPLTGPRRPWCGVNARAAAPAAGCSFSLEVRPCCHVRVVGSPWPGGRRAGLGWAWCFIASCAGSLSRNGNPGGCRGPRPPVPLSQPERSRSPAPTCGYAAPRPPTPTYGGHHEATRRQPTPQKANTQGGSPTLLEHTQSRSLPRLPLHQCLTTGTLPQPDKSHPRYQHFGNKMPRPPQAPMHIEGTYSPTPSRSMYPNATRGHHRGRARAPALTRPISTEPLTQTPTGPRHPACGRRRRPFPKHRSSSTHRPAAAQGPGGRKNAAAGLGRHSIRKRTTNSPPGPGAI